METRAKSKGTQKIEQLMRTLPENSERYMALASAKRFKSSWSELGEWLARISNNGQFLEWGFNSFEEYCTSEIRIRRQTAEKLVLAFRFLERKEPCLLERHTDRPMPDYRSIDLLRRAQEDQHFNSKDYSSLRSAIIEDERSHPFIAKQYKEMVQTSNPDQRVAQCCRSALIAAKRLAASLENLEEVPDALMLNLEQLIGFLTGRLGETGQEGRI